MKLVGPIIALLLLATTATSTADTIQTALTSLSDPAKIATLESDRAANPRIRKIAYWLEVARQDGREPEAEMATALNAHGWSGTLKARLTAAAMARNLPRAVAPTLDKVLANLEFMPHSLNIRKGAKVGQRQIDLANKLLQAGLLTPEDHAAILQRQTPGYEGD